MTKTYEEISDNDIVTIPEQGVDIACCDCGMTHTYSPVGGGSIRLRIRRQDKSTGQVRRWMRRKGEGIFGKRQSGC